MKTILSAVAVSAALTSTAFAGSPAALTVVEPVTAAAAPALAPAANDWAGFYLGAEYGGYSATETLLGNIDDETFGMFAGYNFQNGAMVFGGELAYSAGNYNNGAFAGDMSALDLKARAGYAFGSALVYGFVGGSYLELDDGIAVADYSGLNYGAGISYQLNNGMTLGLEYMERDLDGNGIASGNVLTASSVAARVGWQF